MTRSTAFERCTRRLKRLGGDEALAITEYGMLVALIAVILIAVVTIFGSQIASWFTARTTAVTTT